MVRNNFGSDFIKMNSIIDLYTKHSKVIYEFLFCFVICGIVGWIWETVYVIIAFGDITDRGILFISSINGIPAIWGLPFILMYGVGGALMIWCFKPLASRPVLLFFVAMLTMTIFEYLTSFIYEQIWHSLLWDYSRKFLNFQGRICLFTSVTWGALGIVSVKLLGPLFHRLYTKIKHVNAMHIIILLMVVYIFVCYILRGALFPEITDHLKDDS